MLYSKNWTDHVFKPTMVYCETGITRDVKEITSTFDVSETVLDLQDTATRAFIDIGLTNGALPASDCTPSTGSMSTLRIPLSYDPVVVTAPSLPIPTRDISPPVATSLLATPKATLSAGSDGSTTTVQSIPIPVATSKLRVKTTVQPGSLCFDSSFSLGPVGVVKRTYELIG